MLARLGRGRRARLGVPARRPTKDDVAPATARARAWPPPTPSRARRSASSAAATTALPRAPPACLRGGPDRGRGGRRARHATPARPGSPRASAAACASRRRAAATCCAPTPQRNAVVVTPRARLGTRVVRLDDAVCTSRDGASTPSSATARRPSRPGRRPGGASSSRSRRPASASRRARPPRSTTATPWSAPAPSRPRGRVTAPDRPCVVASLTG